MSFFDLVFQDRIVTDNCIQPTIIKSRKAQLKKWLKEGDWNEDGKWYDTGEPAPEPEPKDYGTCVVCGNALDHADAALWKLVGLTEPHCKDCAPNAKAGAMSDA